MSLQVVVGAGPTGTATALLLAEAGDRVRIVSRRGRGPGHPLVERVTADATDAPRLTELTTGAATLFNCAAPPYDRLPIDTPPLSAALLLAAERTGAGYLNLSNGYGYGPVDGPVTEDTPMAPTTIKGRVRAEMWEEGLAAHRAGRIRFAEVRPGDFLGDRSVLSTFNLTVAPALLAGEPVRVPARLDVAHSWAYPPDVARTLVALARDERSWGRAWHAPTVSELPLGEVAGRLARLAGLPEPSLREMTPLELHEAALADPVIAQVPEMQYLYRRPAVLDTSAVRREFGLTATGLDEVLAVTAASFRPAAV